MLIRKFNFCVLFLFAALSLWAQEPLRFQDEVNKLVAGDSAVGKKNIILFIGSSTIRFWKDLNTTFPDRNILNRGFGGSEMSDLIKYVDRLIVPYHPKQIFIYEGDNDIGYGKNPDDVLKQANQLLLLIREKLPKRTQMFFISPKPSISRWQLKDKYEYYNQELEKWTMQQKKVIFIDVWKPMLDTDGNVMKDLFIGDGLHMNSKGYEIWARIIGPYIK